MHPSPKKAVDARGGRLKSADSSTREAEGSLGSLPHTRTQVPLRNGKASKEDPPPSSERAYLAWEADAASQAMQTAFADATDHLKSAGLSLARAADPRIWTDVATDKRPWVTLAAAAGSGLLAGLIVTPNKRQAAARRLAQVERILDAERAAAGRTIRLPARGGGTWYKRLLAIAFRYAKPAIISSLTAAVTTKATGHDDAPPIGPRRR